MFFFVFSEGILSFDIAAGVSLQQTASKQKVYSFSLSVLIWSISIMFYLWGKFHRGLCAFVGPKFIAMAWLISRASTNCACVLLSDSKQEWSVLWCHHYEFVQLTFLCGFCLMSHYSSSQCSLCDSLCSPQQTAQTSHSLSNTKLMCFLVYSEIRVYTVS